MKTRIFLPVLLLATSTVKAQQGNPFAGIGKKAKVYTLSNGRYDETDENGTKRFIRMGSIIYDAQLKKVVELLDSGKMVKVNTTDSKKADRWFQIDPHADSYTSWSPYSFVYNNPISFNDPTGRDGEFVNENGAVIGNDGKNDNKVYVLKTTDKSEVAYNDATKGKDSKNTDGISGRERKTAEAFIKTNSGNTEAFDKNPSVYNDAVELPSKDIRDQMKAGVSADDGTGGTGAANNREYGGSVRTDMDNQGNPTGTMTVVKDAPGDVRDPATPGAVVVNHNFDKRTNTFFHSHPSGTNDGSSFIQPPSIQDYQGSVNKAGNPINSYEFGKGNGNLYIYSTSGVKAIIKITAF